MKKLLLIAAIIFSINVNAQTSTDSIASKALDKAINIDFRLKKSKQALIISGLCFVAGSVISYISNNATEPDINNYQNTNTYTNAVTDYKNNKKNLSNLSSGFYGLGGATLIIGVVFNF